MKNSSIRLNSYNSLVEKILRDKDGRLVRATFCVYEIDGRIKARLLQAVLLEEVPAIENKTILLSNLNSPKSSYSEFISYFVPRISYIYSNLLYFSGSKPRAPTV